MEKAVIKGKKEAIKQARNKGKKSKKNLTDGNNSAFETALAIYCISFS
jgi:hypothetical protein